MGEEPKYHEFFFDETRWDVKSVYSDLETLGRGAYGLVCTAQDSNRNEKVAIKKLARPFETTVHAKRAYREICLLKHVRDIKHDNIIELFDLFTIATDAQSLNDLYLVTNLMGTDLNNVLRTQALIDDQIIFFTYQILRGLKYLHSCNIIHRDLKPSNLTVNENCELRIIDFGLSRTEREEMTGYVATRWYRAPEIMLRWMRYSKAIDVWSVGCILVEMFTTRPLFPGTNHVDQLNKILNIVGYPNEELMSQINQDARNYLERLEARPSRVDFRSHFPEMTRMPSAINLAEAMLQLNANERITCEQALKHEFVSVYHDPDDEPIGTQFDDSFEENDYTIAQWKEKIFHEIVTFESPN